METHTADLLNTSIEVNALKQSHLSNDDDTLDNGTFLVHI